MTNKKQEILVNIQITESLEKNIKKRIEGTGFKTVSEYINYVLNEITSDMDKENDDTFSQEDEEKVKERLRALGYLE